MLLTDNPTTTALGYHLSGGCLVAKHNTTTVDAEYLIPLCHGCYFVEINYIPNKSSGVCGEMPKIMIVPRASI